MRLEVIDRQGRKTLKYEEAVKYHGGSHVAGVALGWKFLDGAFSLGGIVPPARNEIKLMLNSAPCGVADCLEYVTRAFSRRRVIVDPKLSACSGGCCAGLTISLDNGSATVQGGIRNGFLPQEFVDTAKSIDAGICSPERVREWQKRSRDLAEKIMETKTEEIFDLSVLKDEDTPAVTERGEDYPKYEDEFLLTVADESGPCEISLDEMIRFHDKDHFAGVVLAHKIFGLAFKKLWNDELPLRGDIHIQSGLNPPGLVDSFEYVARAVTRQRFAFTDTGCQAPDSPFGQFSFKVGNGKESLRLKVRDGLLPNDFAAVGRKAEAGMADDEEMSRWISYKHGIGRVLMEMDGEDILEPVC